MKQMYSKLIAATVAIACLSECGGLSTVCAADTKEKKKQQVEPQFRHLYETFGKNSTTKIKLVSDPVHVRMRNGRVPGKRWNATCEKYKFKLTIQLGIDLTVEQLIERLEKLPLPYIRACEVVSDEKEDGVAVYESLGGAGAHGGKQYINMIRGVEAIVIAHEVGHTLEQKARESDPTILDQWEAAIKADQVSISNYGDKVRHEDLGEFAKVYAACLGAGEEQLSKLRKLSPARTQLWETILNDSATASGEDWTRLRGPGATGISSDKGLPIHWSATENIVWKTALPGRGGSSPITLNGRIYLTAYTGYGIDRSKPGDQKDLTLHVLCLNRADGKLIWDKTSKALLPEQDYQTGHIDLHGYASSTPVTDGESLFTFFGVSGVRAYDLDGKQLWHTTVGSDLYHLGWGSGASPILFGDLLIVNASIESESLVALDKKTGKEVWRATGIVESWSTPLVVKLPDGKKELVLSMNGKVLGFDPGTGKGLWECEGISDYVVPMTVADDKGVVYITGGRGSRTRAIRAGGRGDVTETHLLWELNKGCKVPSPLYHDGLLYWVSNLEKAACIDAATGKLHYYKRIERGAFYGSAVMAEGRIYAVSKERGTVVLAAGTEFKQLARNEPLDDSLFNGTPVISNSQLLLRSDRFLYCIGK